MRLLEYQAKELLRRSGVLTPEGVLARAENSYAPSVYPVVLKSQVPTGGRGKLGGVLVAENQKEYKEHLATLLQLKIKNHQPDGVLVEEALDIKHEYYIALRVNREARDIECMYSIHGGIDIESSRNTVATISCEKTDWRKIVATQLHIEHSTITEILDRLYECMVSNDLLLLEINPFIETSGGLFVCADAKVLVDDNARFRQPALPWHDEQSLKPLGGTIGVIANGAGMAMSTVDAIVAMNGAPANFLDIGGGTGKDVFVKQLADIAHLPHVTSIIINIFAGITRCDDIAKGIIAATEELPDLPPLFIRLEGTRRAEAVLLLKNAHIRVESDLAACVRKALRGTA